MIVAQYPTGGSIGAAAVLLVAVAVIATALAAFDSTRNRRSRR